MTPKEFLEKYGMDKFRLGAKGLENNIGIAVTLANEVSECGKVSYWFSEDEIKLAFAQYFLYKAKSNNYSDDVNLLDIFKAMKVYKKINFDDCNKKSLSFRAFIKFEWIEFENDPELVLCWEDIYHNFSDEELKMIQDPDTDEDSIRLLVECK